MISSWEKDRALPGSAHLAKLIELYPDLEGEEAVEVDTLLPEDALYRFSLLSERDQEMIRAAFVAMIDAAGKCGA